jgi:hypothetical protein
MMLEKWVVLSSEQLVVIATQSDPCCLILTAGGYLKLLEMLFSHGADVHANSNVASVALMCDSACGH